MTLVIDNSNWKPYSKPTVIDYFLRRFMMKMTTRRKKMMKRKNQLLILHILGWMFTKDFPGQDIQNALILALLQQNYFLKHFQMQVTISKWDKNQKQQVRQTFDSRFYHQMGRSPKCQCLCFLFLVVPPMQGDNIVKCEQHKALKTVESTGFFFYKFYFFFLQILNILL